MSNTTVPAAESTAPAAVPSVGYCDPARSRWAAFDECPHCGRAMAPEHAHFRCSGCGWRDSCCD